MQSMPCDFGLCEMDALTTLSVCNAQAGHKSSLSEFTIQCNLPKLSRQSPRNGAARSPVSQILWQARDSRLRELPQVFGSKWQLLEEPPGLIQSIQANWQGGEPISWC